MSGGRGYLSTRYYPGEVESRGYTHRDRVYPRLAALLLIAGAVISFVSLLNIPIIFTVAVGYRSFDLLREEVTALAAFAGEPDSREHRDNPSP